MLDAVEGGATAILGALRPDYNLALDSLRRRGLPLELHFGIGSWLGCYHWVPPSPIFAGLPAGRLALEPYVEVVPKYVMSELGGKCRPDQSATRSRAKGRCICSGIAILRA